MPLKEILISARAIISDMEHWTQGTHATDNTGTECRCDDEEAYAFCADGALQKATGGFTLPSGEPNPVYEAAVNAVALTAHRLFGSTDMVELNDEGYDTLYYTVNEENFPALCHAAVLEAFDAAIAGAN